jgi:uncharacterized protein
MDSVTDRLSAALERAGFACIETHISRVYLRGDDVYKTKRSVRYSFLDFTTQAARLRACEAELELNRRLAPDVYRAVVALVPEGDGFRVLSRAEAEAEAEGEAGVTWAVHMRYLDPARRADTLLAAGALGPAEIAEIARRIAEFHEHCRSDEGTARYGSAEAFSGNVEENFRELAPHFRSYLSVADEARLCSEQRARIHKQRALFAARVQDGFSRDGHGDLRLEHLYRADDGAFLAIDCIEFNDRFRYADVALDLAFLAMDLHVHSRADLAELLVAAYARERSDYALYALIDLYLSYRATVRAKVSAFLAADPGVSAAARSSARARAEASFALALSVLERPAHRPRLIVCCGLMASGKSTVARELGAELAAPVVSADRIRKHLLHADALSAHHDAPFRGSYTEAVTEQVYAALREHAATVLRSGRSVILDATYRDRHERSEVCELAEALSAELMFFECRVPRDVTMARLAERAKHPSESDGRAEIFDAVARMFQPLDELGEARHVVLDTAQPLAANLAVCRARLGKGS